MFKAIAAGAASWRGVAIVIIAWIILAALITSLSPSIEEVSTNDAAEFLPNGTESLQATELRRAKFPANRGLPAVIIYRNPDGINDQDIARVAQIDAIIREANRPNIPLVISDFAQPQFPGADTPPQSQNQADTRPEISPDGTAITITVIISGPPAEDEFADTIEWLREIDDEIVVELPSTVQVTGPAGILTDAIAVFQTFDFRVSAITILLVLIILLAIYRSPLLALLPILCVGIALTVAQAIAALLTDNLGLALNGQVTAIMAVLNVRRRHRLHTIHRLQIPRRTTRSRRQIRSHPRHHARRRTLYR